MNAVLGIGLVATLGSYKLIHKSSDHDQCMIWPIERLWVVAYSAWNLAFVSRMYPGHYSDHFVILGIPIIFMIWCNGL
ncbi:DUF5692 family protein [Endozoicomonas sp.]|uniref:DUF5692 family protein n=1 Tax=Endozoicomonas sp. TaxID=1892382 RepID=UPI00383B3E2D